MAELQLRFLFLSKSARIIRYGCRLQISSKKWINLYKQMDDGSYGGDWDVWAMDDHRRKIFKIAGGRRHTGQLRGQCDWVDHTSRHFPLSGQMRRQIWQPRQRRQRRQRRRATRRPPPLPPLRLDWPPLPFR